MKKKLVISLALATTVIVSATAGAFAAAKINLIVNGKLSNAETKVIDGTTYVPLRAAAELLGAEVKYGVLQHVRSQLLLKDLHHNLNPIQKQCHLTLMWLLIADR